jgi:hypothetical protein
MQMHRTQAFREFGFGDQRKMQVTIVGHIERAAYADLPSSLTHSK